MPLVLIIYPTLPSPHCRSPFAIPFLSPPFPSPPFDKTTDERTRGRRTGAAFPEGEVAVAVYSRCSKQRVFTFPTLSPLVPLLQKEKKEREAGKAKKGEKGPFVKINTRSLTKSTHLLYFTLLPFSSFFSSSTLLDFTFLLAIASTNPSYSYFIFFLSRTNTANKAYPSIHILSRKHRTEQS